MNRVTASVVKADVGSIGGRTGIVDTLAELEQEFTQQEEAVAVRV